MFPYFRGRGNIKIMLILKQRLIMAKKFKHNKIGAMENYNTNTSSLLSFSAISKYLIVAFCVVLVVVFGKYLVRWAQVALWFLGQSTVRTVSSSLWKEMKRDMFGNINMLLVGIWWEEHHGGYLADTMIVASRNPELWAVTMISIPRDLYIVDEPYKWRINWLFSRGYNHGDKSIWSWAQNLLLKIKDVVWLDIPYYAVVDFQWFKDVIDTLWGIEMYIPNTIHDTTYPDANLWYITFHLWAWPQILNWNTALMYARSRHTTSDFSRSQRQQEIIKAVITTATQKWNITNVSKLKELHTTYTQMVTTNISLKEMIWMFQYVYNFENIFTFGLNTYCTYKSYTMTDAGCFLYNWNREAFGGMAVMVPNWSTPSTVSFYDYINNFSFFVTHNQWYLIENPRILVKNAINKTHAYNNNKRPTWWANKIAVKMKKYGFKISSIESSEQKFAQTTIITYGDDYAETIEALQYFLPINNIQTWYLATGQELSYDIELILWDDFIDHIVQIPFSYEK